MTDRISKRKAGMSIILAFTCFLLLIGQARATSMDFVFSFAGYPIDGEAGDEYPNFFPEVSAIFTVDGAQMTLLLTYGGDEPVVAKNQALAGLTWDMSGFIGTPTAISAVIAPSSYSLSLVGGGVSDWEAAASGAGIDADDLSGQWAYKGNISAGSSSYGPIGSYGVGGVGDINLKADTFGTNDIIDPNKTLVSPAPDGTDFTILNDLADPTQGSLAAASKIDPKGPYVQDAMLFSFVFLDGQTQLMQDIQKIKIFNVQPIFGTDGAFLVPEPATMLLFGAGLIGLAAVARKKFFRKV